MIGSRIWKLALVALGSSLYACAAAHGGADDEVEGSKGTKAPIIGGARANAYAESAIVDMYKDGVLQAACSGSVIAPQVVLTAGHCVDGFNGWKIRAPYTPTGAQTANSSGGTTYDWAEGGSETV